MAYPKKILMIENKEKKFHEKWLAGRDELNFPHPYRLLLASHSPNVGKTLWVKNIVLRADPKFQEIFLLHCGEDETTEYDEIECTKLKELPPVNNTIFNRDVKTLLICEDKNFEYSDKTQRHRLDRWYGYASTHKNVSIICCSQNFFAVPSPIRAMTNVFCLWKTRDLDQMKCIGRRVGLMKEEIQLLMRKYIKDVHDTIWIDCTKNTPMPIRRNGWEAIDDFNEELQFMA